MSPAETGSRRHPTHTSRRYRALALGLLLAMAMLAVLLAKVQIIDGASYAAQAKDELDQTVTLQSVRGSIYDRDGDLLAVSVPRYDIIADDFLISSPRTVAEELAPLLHKSYSSLVSLFSESNGYVLVAKQVSSEVNTEIEDLAIAGISTQVDALRVSPGASVFQPVLGGVNAAGEGDAGLEYEYNSDLQGKTGEEIVPEGPGNVQLPGQPQIVSTARAGESLVLSLDEPLQVEVTKDVTAEMITSHAQTGIAVVDDVKTGAVLAMVDLCRLNNGVCSATGTIGPAPSNLALTSVYQPGSVMKIATISYALHYHLIAPTTVLSVPYQLTIGGYTFQDAEFHPTQPMPVSEILAQSSNIGTIKIGHLLGATRLGYALHQYGFGQLTGLNWPGESPGIVSPSSTWDELTGDPEDVATWGASMAPSIAIGTGQAVTAMQVLDAYSAIANKGVFIPPHLVDDIITSSGKEIAVARPKTRRAIDAATAAEMVPMFEGVVQDGTAVSACVPGYTVAGKTGTAQAPSSTGLGYVPGDWNATFVGFVPAEAPRLAAVVTFNHPTPIYGGSVAAPVFAKIMGYALRHFDIAPPVQSKTSQVQCAAASQG